MSLKCLGCKSHQRTDSDIDLDFKLKKHDGQCKGPTRIWSGPLPTSFGKDNINKMKMGTRSGPLKGMKKRSMRLRRHRSAREVEVEEEEESGEPKLIRSRGVRRDWSFENLSDHDQPPKGMKRSKTVEEH